MDHWKMPGQTLSRLRFASYGCALSRLRFASYGCALSRLPLRWVVPRLFKSSFALTKYNSSDRDPLFVAVHPKFFRFLC